MKVVSAIGVFLGFGVLIATGLVLAVAKGNPWLLIGGLGLYTLLFVRVGCLQH